jgi:hypothetical protein
MSDNTFTLQNINRVNFYGNDNSAYVYLEGVSTGTSGVCVRGSLFVTDNVFSSMGVCDATSAGGSGGGGGGGGGGVSNVFTIPAVDFVNGFVFPPYYSSEESQLFVVRVPEFSSIQTSFPNIAEGQTFDTVIYGTSIGSSPDLGTCFLTDITVYESTDNSTIFDRRLVSDKGISGGLSFHFADATLKYYQGVVIRSRMGSAGVSMYPYATSFYTC